MRCLRTAIQSMEGVTSKLKQCLPSCSLWLSTIEIIRSQILHVILLFIKQKHRPEHRREEARSRCDICNFDPRDEETLAEHKKMHVGLSPLQCVVCKKMFSHKRNIRPHMRLHVSTVRMSLSITCFKIFTLNSLLNYFYVFFLSYEVDWAKKVPM